MNNISIGNTKTYTYNSECFKPAHWCTQQWKKLGSEYSGLWDLAKRIITFIPLVLASIITYPISLPFCISLSTTTISSNNINVVKGSGIAATRILNLNSNINEVEFENSGNLVIKKGNENTLSTTADDNLIDSIVTRVEKNKLIISMKSGAFQFQIRPSYTLTIPSSLQYFSFSGSGDATIDEISAKKFKCDISGSGKVHIIKGNVDHQTVELSGSGQYSSPNVQAGNSNVSISGSGNVTLRAINDLNVDISGSGVCAYLGTPKISKNISGSGSVSPQI
jgi:hypothetical protein